MVAVIHYKPYSHLVGDTHMIMFFSECAIFPQILSPLMCWHNLYCHTRLCSNWLAQSVGVTPAEGWFAHYIVWMTLPFTILQTNLTICSCLYSLSVTFLLTFTIHSLCASIQHFVIWCTAALTSAPSCWPCPVSCVVVCCVHGCFTLS